MIDRKDGEYRLLLDSKIPIYSLLIKDKELIDININLEFRDEITKLVISKIKKIKSKINKGNKMYEIRRTLSALKGKIKIPKEDLIAIQIVKYLDDDLLIEDTNYAQLRILEDSIRTISNRIATKNIKYDNKNYLSNNDYYHNLKKRLQDLINYLSFLEKEAKDNPDLLNKIRELKIILLNEINSLDNNIEGEINIIKKATYLKNINILSNAIFTTILENYLEYIDTKSDKISITEVLNSIPPYIIELASMDIIVNEKTKTLANIHKIVDSICLKEDNSKYSEEEINKYILITNKENKLLDEDDKKRTL